METKALLRDGLKLSELPILSEADFERRGAVLDTVEDLSLVESHPLCDVVLSVRKSIDGTARVKIGSSSAMLSLVSDFFAALFRSDAVRRGETIKLSDKITLPGIKAINAAAFGVMNRVVVSMDDLVEVMVAAEHCDVAVLSRLCDEFIDRSAGMLDIDTVSRVLSELNSLGFTQKADEFVDRMDDRMVKLLFLDPAALDLEAGVFAGLVRSDSLALSEEDIWFRCLEWAQKKAGRMKGESMTEQLRKLKPYIRFPLLNEDFLRSQVEPTRVLCKEELLQIVLANSRDECLDQSAGHRGMIWEEAGVTPGIHSIKDRGITLNHGANKAEFATALVGCDTVFFEGIHSAEFELVSGDHCMFGVLQGDQPALSGESFGFPLIGIGCYTYTGYVFYPRHCDPFAEPIHDGDRIGVSVHFWSLMRAVLSFTKNGRQMGFPIQLESKLNIAKGVRFAVQTYDPGDKIRLLSLSSVKD